MPNNPRGFVTGEIYHIFNRGYDKRKIFLDSTDRRRFMDSLCYLNSKDSVTLRLVRGQTSYRREKLVDILAFCLMSNHYHLILRELKAGGVSAFMRKLSNSYTGYFNKRYERKALGGLFQSRFKAVHIETDSQLDIVFCYLHTNPIEIKDPGWKEFKVKDYHGALAWLRSYKWSSLNDYIGKKPIYPEILNVGFYRNFYKDEQGCTAAIRNWVRYKADQVLPEVPALGLTLNSLTTAR